MKPGDPDGFGRYAALDIDDGGALLCHECGEWKEHLATHARMAHGITAADYRVKHGLGATTKLVGPGPRERMRQAWEANRDEKLALLKEHRKPLDALAASPSHASTRAWAPETKARWRDRSRERRGRDLTETEREELLEVDHDLARWAVVARRLLEHDDVTATSLARACDVTAATIHQRLKRYPAEGDGRARCSVEGCDRLVAARGWCTRHYWRWSQHGDPEGGRE